MKAIESHLYRETMKVAILLVAFAWVSLAAADEYVFKQQMKRDPFVPLITPAGFLVNLEPSDEKNISLEGIMFDAKGDSMAIINGELVHVGDAIGSAVVSSIEPNKVTIIQDNEKIEVELRGEE